MGLKLKGQMHLHKLIFTHFLINKMSQLKTELETETIFLLYKNQIPSKVSITEYHTNRKVTHFEK